MSASDDSKNELELLRTQLQQEQIINRELKIQLKTIKDSKISIEQSGKSKKVHENGIEYSAYKRHPTCPFCGLEDAGKEASIRPTETHMLNCRHRKLMSIPLVEEDSGKKDEHGKTIFIKVPRKGGFIGDCLQRQLRFPVRKLMKFKPKDAKTGKLKDEEVWVCDYFWKTAEGIVDWVWGGEVRGWIKWFEWNPSEQKTRAAVVRSVVEERWLAGFLKRPK